MSVSDTRKGKRVAKDTPYRIFEDQENYVKNLYLERKRKNKNLTSITHAEVMRDLLEIGIKQHRMERREKYEMSGYFRAELRTFTENFFKENNDNFIFRLKDISRNLRFVVLLLIEILKLLLKVYLLSADMVEFEDLTPDSEKKEYFDNNSNVSAQRHKQMLESLIVEMGEDGSILFQEKNIREGKAFESLPTENSSNMK